MSKNFKNLPSSKNNTLGFTLIELMVTLLIAGILIVIAVPAFQDATLGSKLGALANTAVSSVNIAKGEAIKRNAVLKMCATVSGSSCVSSGGWQQGWIVFRDIDGDGVLDSDDTLIQRQAALPTGFKLSAVDNDGNAVHAILFQPTGVGTTYSLMTLCRSQPKVGAQERIISISTTGRTSVTKTTNGACS